MNPRMDRCDLSECGRFSVPQCTILARGFVSKCRAIKSLDIDLMKTPVNAETSSRSTSSNNFKFGDPLPAAEHRPARRTMPSPNAPITALCGNILVHRVPSDTLDIVIMFGYFADAYTW